MLAPAEVLVVNDTLDALLLGSFFFGLVFVVLSLGMGMAHVGFGHDHGGFHAHGHGEASGSTDWLSNINVGSVLAFLTWFGGVAYLVRNAVEFNVVLSLLIGIVAGTACAALVLRLMRLLRSKEVYLDEREERLTGAMARVSSSIRVDGTGEVTYVLNGVRQVTAARSATGKALPRGSEVVIMRRERGIAFVEPWVEESAADEWERRFAVESGEVSKALPQLDR
jgi:membrane protein implicated in regulation of membrane protease activity